jgi:beta-lactamase regulating signal transducer with metallopeptidase domain
MEAFLTALLQCSLSMSIITLLYAAALPILSKRYDPKWRYMIWLVIATGWLIPFRPLIELPFLPVQSTDTSLMPVQLIPASPMINNTAEILTTAHETAVKTPELSIGTIAVLIWAVGVIFMLAYHVLRHRRFMKVVGRWSEAVSTPEILNLMDILKQEQGIKAKIEYKICSSVSSPMMVDFFHPVILMPPIQLSENELTLILKHELTHYKRHDLWYKAMILTATILHWFNPVAYFMARAASVQCEISCDALVLRNADMQVRKQYGETVIAVVRNGRSHQTALSTNFYGGKRGMKNRITSMLDSKLKKAGIAVLCIVLAGIMLTGATLVSAGSQASSIPNTAFTEEEFGKILALRFNGYEDMTVSEFQQKVWTTTDTVGYQELLERFYNDTQLDEMKDTNDIASFLFYELTPLTAENWKSRYFGNSGMTSYKDANNAQFEYSCTLSILDADHLSVGEYNKARKAVMNGLISFFQNRSEKELQDESGMKEAIDTEIDSLAEKWSNDALIIGVDYFFIPLEVYESYEGTMESGDNYVEERKYPNATEEDYHSLLKLKTADFQSRALTDFNADLLKWANENYERMERIGNDTVYQDFNVSLSPEELSFVTLTANYSGSENAALIRSSRTGEPKEDIGFSDSLLEKTLEKEGQTRVWCSLYYQGSYHVTDDSRMTVGERDRCIGGVISDIRKYWDETSLDELLTMKKQGMLAKLEGIAEQYSNDLITVSIIPDQVSFDVMEERSNNQ